MKKLAFLVAAAALFGLSPLAARFGAVPAALALVGFAVMLAVAASGTPSSLAVAGGAVGAFGGTVLSSVSPAVGGALLVGLAFAERTTRVRGNVARVAHLVVALVGGALAGALSSGYAGSSPVVLGVAVTVASVLVALPLLVEADDPVAHALDQAAEGMTGPVGAALHEGASLRRHVTDVPLDRNTAHRVRKTWQSLIRLAEARSRLDRAQGPRIATEKPTAAEAVTQMVDQRILDHVKALSRAYTAVDTAHAATVGLDDTAMKSVETVGESLDEVSRAIVEVKG